MNGKPCTAEEIDAYFQFASLPLAVRRRRVYERMIETMPDSPFVHDLLFGRIEMPKKTGRKSKSRSLSKAKPKTLKAKVATKAALPNGGQALPKWAISPNPNIDWDE